MIVEIYKLWISFCMTVGLIIGLFGPFVLAAYVLWSALWLPA